MSCTWGAWFPLLHWVCLPWPFASLIGPRDPICLGFRLMELIYLATKPKPLAQPSFYHWKKKKKYHVSICYFSFFLFLNFFRILVGERVLFTEHLPQKTPTHAHISLRDCTCQILCWRVFNVGYVITALHDLCYLALGSSTPLTTPHPQPPFCLNWAWYGREDSLLGSIKQR